LAVQQLFSMPFAASCSSTYAHPRRLRFRDTGVNKSAVPLHLDAFRVSLGRQCAFSLSSWRPQMSITTSFQHQPIRNLLSLHIRQQWSEAVDNRFV
jgi:hypothetical protein